VSRQTRSRVISHLLSGGLVILVFLAVISPYLRANKDAFGHYFYNVNTTFYVWYDDKAEVEAPTSVKAHGDSVGWPDLPPDQIPGPAKYVRETSLREFADRMWFGAKLAASRHLVRGSYGYSPYLVAYPLFALLLVGAAYRCPALRPDLRRLVSRNRFAILFSTTYLVGYLLLYTFYMRISGGQRFMQALIVPLLFVSTMSMTRPVFAGIVIPVGGSRLRAVTVFNLTLLPVLICHALYNVLIVVDDFYAGD
jgi:hypothetical protein